MVFKIYIPALCLRLFFLQSVRPELAVSHAFQGAVLVKIPQDTVCRRRGNTEAFAQVSIAKQIVFCKMVQHKLSPKSSVLRILSERFFFCSGSGDRAVRLRRAG